MELYDDWFPGDPYGYSQVARSMRGILPSAHYSSSALTSLAMKLVDRGGDPDSSSSYFYCWLPSYLIMGSSSSQTCRSDTCTSTPLLFALQPLPQIVVIIYEIIEVPFCQMVPLLAMDEDTISPCFGLNSLLIIEITEFLVKLGGEGLKMKVKKGL